MKPETYNETQAPEAAVSPSTQQDLPGVKRKPSPFLEAAGMVLAVGLGVLRIVGKGIKGSVRLLMTQKR